MPYTWFEEEGEYGRAEGWYATWISNMDWPMSGTGPEFGPHASEKEAHQACAEISNPPGVSA